MAARELARVSGPPGLPFTPTFPRHTHRNSGLCPSLPPALPDRQRGGQPWQAWSTVAAPLSPCSGCYSRAPHPLQQQQSKSTCTRTLAAAGPGSSSSSGTGSSSGRTSATGAGSSSGSGGLVGGGSATNMWGVYNHSHMRKHRTGHKSSGQGRGSAALGNGTLAGAVCVYIGQELAA